MSVYLKLNEARTAFHKLQLKKTGLNKFAGYSYFELGDFLIPALEMMDRAGLCAYISFGSELATMTVVDMLDGSQLSITSPMSSAALKGCHDVQNLGAVQTYLRRYLWVTALEIVEHDALDSSEPLTKKTTVNTPMPKKEEVGLTDDEISHITDMAQAIKETDAVSGVDLIEQAKLEEPQMIALWGMLDSKTRSAIKAEKEARKAKK
jgi:ERF superfamily